MVIMLQSDSEDDDRKMPALDFGADRKDGHEKRKAIVTNREGVESSSTPRKIVWDRTVARNNLNKQMHK